jgi:hypothetical protein
MSKKTDLELLDIVVNEVRGWSVAARNAYQELVRRLSKRAKLGARP